MPLSFPDLKNLLGTDADSLLNHKPKIQSSRLHIPGSKSWKEIFAQSDRSAAVQKNLDALYGNGRLVETGYLSILPVDQGIEHSAGASFAKNPDYFDHQRKASKYYYYPLERIYRRLWWWLF